MDKIEKALNKLSANDRKSVKRFLILIKKDDLKNVDIKKLKGFDNIFRIRKGKIRIVISRSNDEIKIVKIERRSEKVYKLN